MQVRSATCNSCCSSPLSLVATLHDGPIAAGEALRLEVDTANLTAGMYVVSIEGETFAETRRFSVVR